MLPNPPILPSPRHLITAGAQVEDIWPGGRPVKSPSPAHNLRLLRQVSFPGCGVWLAMLMCPAPIFTPQVIAREQIVQASIAICAFELTSPDVASPRVKRAPASVHGMQLHGRPARRHLDVTDPPGGMPAAAQRPRNDAGGCASHCTESPGRPLSCPVESPHALSEQETLFHAGCRRGTRKVEGCQCRRSTSSPSSTFSASRGRS